VTAVPGTRVLVTGAARGMGRQHCEHLARCGARVTALDNDVAALAAAGAAFHSAGLDVRTVSCDVADRAQVEQAVHESAQALGGIDAIVSNAGTVHADEGLEQTDDDDWDRTMAVHVGGARNLCRAALPHLRRSPHPRVVIVSSLWAQRGGGFGYAYCAAKGALISFARNLAVEVGPEQILVNSISPGSVPTRMAAGYSAADIAADAETIPLRRWGAAEEISKLVAFLVSPDAAYLTGQNVAINGGQLFGGA
jgi:NAD(P)-dependent dehydrogenase (short-subunit alcohol dehydrogenase family)